MTTAFSITLHFHKNQGSLGDGQGDRCWRICFCILETHAKETTSFPLGSAGLYYPVPLLLASGLCGPYPGIL